MAIPLVLLGMLSVFQSARRFLRSRGHGAARADGGAGGEDAGAAREAGVGEDRTGVDSARPDQIQRRTRALYRRYSSPKMRFK